MIVYLDTSALAKRYVEEAGTNQVRTLLRGRRRVAVSRLAYAELAAAVARLTREGVLAPGQRDAILARLPADFAALHVVEVRWSLVEAVPALVLRNPLRGYDAVHLAAALHLAQEVGPVDFWSADRRLADAARVEGLRATQV